MRFPAQPFTAGSSTAETAQSKSPPPRTPVVSFGWPRDPWESIGLSGPPTVHTLGRLASLSFGRQWSDVLLLIPSDISHTSFRNSSPVRRSDCADLRVLLVCRQDLTRTPGYDQTQTGSQFTPQCDPVSVAALHPMFVALSRNTPRSLLHRRRQGSLPYLHDLSRNC